MRKRTLIFFILLSALLLGASVLGFQLLFRSGENHTVRNDTYRAVPVDALLVQHFSQWNTLARITMEPGSYFERAFHPAEGMRMFLGRIETFVASECPELDRAEALCSLHPSAKNTIAALYIISTAEAEDPGWWDRFIATTPGSHITRAYDGQTISVLYGEEEGKTVYVSHVENLLIASSSLVVLESSLRHMLRGNSLAYDPEFDRMVSETPVSKPTRIFLPHDRISSLFAALLGVPMQKYATFLRNTARWTVLDGYIDGKEIRMDGYSLYPAGQEHYFAAWQGQQPQKLMAPEVLPAATLAGITLGLSDVTRYTERVGRFSELKKSGRKMPDKDRIDWFNLLYPTEVTLACVPFRGAPEWIGVIHSRYIHQARIQFALLNKQEEGTVMQNPVPNLLSEMFGPVFSLAPAAFYCYQGPFILFGSGEVLHDILRRHAAGNFHSLAAAISQTAASSGIMNSSGLTLFLQASVGTDWLPSLVDKRYAERLESWRMYNAQYAFLQFSSLEDRMYAHLSVYGDSLETSPLVPRQREIRLAKGVVQDSLQRSTPPYKVYNHLTLKDNELFQTPWPECRLILRDHAGKTLWEKKMEGNIQDRVEQIDFLKNNKLQMLFSIGNRLYLLDRLGRNVSPYPRSYTTGILYGPFVFDPAGNKDYVILLVHQDNILRCYDKSGNVLSLWNDFQLPGYLTGAPRFLRADDTGYWVIYTNSQTVFLSEKGETRALFTQKDCLDPQADIQILGPFEMRGTTIEGKPLTIILD